MLKAERAQRRQRQRVKTMASFLPTIVRRFIHKANSAADPDKEFEAPISAKLHTVALFADVSGFTKMSETLARKGPRGAEQLGFYLNRYLERLVKIIARSGGDIFKFAGDAMVVLWPPPEGKEEEHLNNEEVRNEWLKLTVHRVAQCCLDIQAELRNVHLAEDVTLNVKLGVGVGPATVLHVGGVYQRLEYLALGPPLVQAFHAEHASVSGEVVMSRQAYAFIKDVAQVEERNEESVLLTGLSKSIRNASVGKSSSGLREYDQLRVRRYIPAAVLPHLFLGTNNQRLWAGELRQVTIVFVNLGLQASNLADLDPQRLAEIQNVVSSVQNAVYRYEGSLNKFLIDDKGSTLVVVFGLPPLAHEDDPARAVLSSLRIHRFMRKAGYTASIGVTSGVARCGLIGSATRREYTVLGDVVNLSARLMQAAKGGVLVDASTADSASNDPRLRCVSLPSIDVKGKTQPVPVARPLYIDYKFGEYKAPRCEFTIGREDVIARLFKLTDEMSRTKRGHVAILSAEVGLGKSHILRFMTHEYPSNDIFHIWAKGNVLSSKADRGYMWRQIMSVLVVGDLADDEDDDAASIVRAHEVDAPFDETVRASQPSEADRELEARDRASTDGSTHELPAAERKRKHPRLQAFIAQFLSEKAPELMQHVAALNPLLGTDFDDPHDLHAHPDRQAEMLAKFITLFLRDLCENVRLVLVLDEAQYMSDLDWSLTQHVCELVNQHSVDNLCVWVGTRPMHVAKYKPRYSAVPPQYYEVQKLANHVITLHPWRLCHTLELLAKHFGVITVDPELTELVHHRAGGTPLFVVKFSNALTHHNALVLENNHAKLADAWADRMELDVEQQIPYRVQRIIAGQIDVLQPAEMFALKVAAVLCIGKSTLCNTFLVDMVHDCHPIAHLKGHMADVMDSLVKLRFVEECAPPSANGIDIVSANDDRTGRFDLDSPPTADFTTGSENARSRAASDQGASQVLNSTPLVRTGRYYRFTHGFMRDVLYQLMLYRQRRKLHELALSVIERARDGSAKVAEGAPLPASEITRTVRARHQSLVAAFGNAAATSHEVGTPLPAGNVKDLDVWARATSGAAACNQDDQLLLSRADETNQGEENTRAKARHDSTHSAPASLGKPKKSGGFLSSLFSCSCMSGDAVSDPAAESTKRRANSHAFSEPVADTKRTPLPTVTENVPVITIGSTSAHTRGMSVSTLPNKGMPIIRDGHGEGAHVHSGKKKQQGHHSAWTVSMLHPDLSPRSNNGFDSDDDLEREQQGDASSNASSALARRPSYNAVAGLRVDVPDEPLTIGAFVPGTAMLTPRPGVEAPLSPMTPTIFEGDWDSALHSKRNSLLRQVHTGAHHTGQLRHHHRRQRTGETQTLVLPGSGQHVSLQSPPSRKRSPGADSGEFKGVVVQSVALDSGSEAERGSGSLIQNLTDAIYSPPSKTRNVLMPHPPSSRAPKGGRARRRRPSLMQAVQQLGTRVTATEITESVSGDSKSDVNQGKAPESTKSPSKTLDLTPRTEEELERLIFEMHQSNATAHTAPLELTRRVTLILNQPFLTSAQMRRLSVMQQYVPGANGVVMQASDNQEDADEMSVPYLMALTNMGPSSLFSKEEKALHKLLTTDLTMWTFDIFELDEASSHRPLTFVGFAAFRQLGLLDAVALPRVELIEFLRAIERGYQMSTSIYHSAIHVADVVQTCVCMIECLSLRGRIANTELLAFLIAVIIHDFHNPGLTNQFLVASTNERSLLLNDVRVLPHFHCADAFKLMRLESTNILQGFTHSQRQTLRAHVLSLVMATNLSDQIDFDALIERVLCSPELEVAGPQRELRQGDGDTLPVDRLSSSKHLDSEPLADVTVLTGSSRLPAQLTTAQAELVLSLVLRAADMSNSAKPTPIFNKWKEIMAEEMWSQGDREREENLRVSRFMDRSKPESIDHAQTVFMVKLVLPAFRALTRLNSAFTPCVEQVEKHMHSFGSEFGFGSS